MTDHVPPWVYLADVPPEPDPEPQPAGAGMVNTAGVFVLMGLTVCAAVTDPSALHKAARALLDAFPDLQRGTPRADAMLDLVEAAALAALPHPGHTPGTWACSQACFDANETTPEPTAALRRFWQVPTMEGSDGHLWVRRDSASAAIQGVPDLDGATFERPTPSGEALRGAWNALAAAHRPFITREPPRDPLRVGVLDCTCGDWKVTDNWAAHIARAALASAPTTDPRPVAPETLAAVDWLAKHYPHLPATASPVELREALIEGPTDSEQRDYRLDAADAENRRLNWREWEGHVAARFAPEDPA